MTRHARPGPGRSRRCNDAPSREQRWWVGLLLLATMGTASDALAQDDRPPNVEIAGGYQFFLAPDAETSSGWLASVAVPLGERFAVVGEVANLSQREWIPYVLESEAQWWTLLGGVRHAWRWRAVTPFVEVLGGVALSRFRDVRYLTAANTGDLIPLADAIHHSFGVFQVGGGASVRITNRVGVRLAAHSQALYAGSAYGISRLRFTTAAVMGIGTR